MNLAPPAVPASKELKDEEVLALSVQSPDMFGVIVDRYQTSFLRLALRIVSRKEAAEDVCQDAFVKIYLNAGKFRKIPGVEFKSWAYKILLNTAFMHYRKLKRDLSRISYRDDLLVDDKVLNIVSKEGSEDFHETKNFVESILGRMPDDFSLMLKQHYLEDQSYKKMAVLNNTTVDAIRMKIFRARKIFKELLSSYSI